MSQYVGGAAHWLKKCLDPNCQSDNLTLGTKTNSKGQPTNSSVKCNECGKTYEINIFK